MKRVLVAIVALLLLAGCTAGANGESSSGNSASGEAAASATQSDNPASGESARLLIIDTDTGADDASALIMAAKDPSVKILGVTVLAGNVDLEQGTRNALAALELAGSNAPVYRGSSEKYNGEPIEAVSVYGEDGMGDAGLINPRGEAQQHDAVDFIVEAVREHPGEVEIVLLGPATNIAKAIDRDPAAMAEVKAIWSMGTPGLGPGNATPVAEFNVYQDAPAYKRMLDSGLPVNIVGFDMCMDALWTDAQFAQLEESGEVGSFVAKSFAVLRELYASNGAGGTTDCDALAMTCVLQPDFVTDTAKFHGSCITDKGETYGQVILYKEGMTYDLVSGYGLDYNITLVTGIKASEYFDRFLAAVS